MTEAMWPGRCGHHDGQEEWCGLRDLWLIGHGVTLRTKQGSLSGGGGGGGQTRMSQEHDWNLTHNAVTSPLPIPGRESFAHPEPLPEGKTWRKHPRPCGLPLPGPPRFPPSPSPKHRDVQTGQDGACTGGGDTLPSQEQLGSGSELMTLPTLSDGPAHPQSTDRKAQMKHAFGATAHLPMDTAGM